jgi:hypothetical protein
MVSWLHPPGRLAVPARLRLPFLRLASGPTGREELGYRSLAAQMKQLAAFPDFILEHLFGEPQCEDKRLPRVNAKDPPLFAINKSLEPNWTKPVIAVRLWSANRYMHSRFVFCAPSHQL